MLRFVKELFDARKGFRWSLYFVHSPEGLLYVLHENSAARLVGYVLGPIENGKKRSQDWALHLSFNHGHKHIELIDEYFKGGAVSEDLWRRIETLDPGWQDKGGRPVFVDAQTKKRLPLGRACEAAFQTRAERMASIREMVSASAFEAQGATLSSVVKAVFT